MSKLERINSWLSIYPEDVNHPDLEFNALAGSVLCKDGLYREWNEYVFYKEECEE